jgi:pimeloyl-ACP methyl ester carboxylesterase
VTIVVGVLVGLFSWRKAGWQSFVSFNGTQLAYRDRGGSGPAVILLHGLLVDSEMNWGKRPFSRTRWRVISLDARGHGRSSKPQQPNAYADRAMARDIIALADHLGLSKLHVVGYSLGANTALETALLEDPRICSVVLGGIGNDDTSEADYRAISDEMLAAVPPSGAFYRSMADDLGADKAAIAAWARGAVLPQIPPDQDLSAVTIPALVVNGSEDHDPAPLAARLPNAESAVFPGDHLSVLEQSGFTRAIINFVDRVARDQ